MLEPFKAGCPFLLAKRLWNAAVSYPLGDGQLFEMSAVETAERALQGALRVMRGESSISHVIRMIRYEQPLRDERVEGYRRG